MALGAVILSGCAATPTERRSGNLWRDPSKQMLPPLAAPPVGSAGDMNHEFRSVGHVAIWIHPTNLKQSIVAGIEGNRPNAGLFLFDLDGNKKQQFTDFIRPKDVEFEYSVPFGDKRIDICAVLEQGRKRIRFFGLNTSKGKMWEITGNTNVFEELEGAIGTPMGMAIYRRADGKTYALVSRKADDGGGILFQYELIYDDGRFDLKFIRDFGRFGGFGTVEQMTVDDLNGYVFYFDRIHGIRKYFADPDRPYRDRELATFAPDGWEGPVAGLMIWPGEKPGTGYIVALDSAAGRSRVRLFPREGQIGEPHSHLMEVMQLTFKSAGAGGMDGNPQRLDDRFPEGVLAMSDPTSGRINLFSWKRAKMQQDAWMKKLKRDKFREQNRY